MSILKSRVAQFNQLVHDTEQTSTAQTAATKWKKNSKDYGRPRAGSLSEHRGIMAGDHVCREILTLCETITQYSTTRRPKTGRYSEVRFKVIFEVYSTYSDKVVGLLIRARKYGLVSFVGEMLYQGQDDNVLITLAYPIDEIRRRLQASGDPKNCVKMK